MMNRINMKNQALITFTEIDNHWFVVEQSSKVGVAALENSDIKMGDKFTVTLTKSADQKLGFGLTRIGEIVTINEIKPEGAITQSTACEILDKDRIETMK